MACGQLAETPLHESIERAAGTACGPQGRLHLTQPPGWISTSSQFKAYFLSSG